jgi:hypothetical protein
LLSCHTSAPEKTPVSGGSFGAIVAPDAAASDFFGISVAVSGDSALVGAPLDDHAAGLDAGSAYVFQRVGILWLPTAAKLVALQVLAPDPFGWSAAPSGGTGVLSAASAALQPDGMIVVAGIAGFLGLVEVIVTILLLKRPRDAATKAGRESIEASVEEEHLEAGQMGEGLEGLHVGLVGLQLGRCHQLHRFHNSRCIKMSK